jgi:hypothetical protein
LASQVLYPLQESIDKEGIALATESREDHEKTKEALKDLDGKSLKEHGVRQKVDLMMKDLLEHIGKEETEDLVSGTVIKRNFDFHKKNYSEMTLEE